jgi:hypothetical protein
MLETDPSFLQFSWDEMISPRLAALTGEENPDWAGGLISAKETLAKEISSQNLPRIQAVLKVLRRETGLRFFQVDVYLKSFCGELRKVAEPLEGVLLRIAS